MPPGPHLPVRNSPSVQWVRQIPPPILHIEGLREGKGPEHLDIERWEIAFQSKGYTRTSLGNKQPM